MSKLSKEEESELLKLFMDEYNKTSYANEMAKLEQYIAYKAQQEAIGFHRWVSRSGWKVSHFDAADRDIYLHESSGSIPFYELNETHYKTTE